MCHVESIAQLASTCQHPPGSPESLTNSMANIFAPFVTAQGKQNASVADFANLLPETYVPHRMPLCDGAGMSSHADHTFAKRSKLQPLADKWWDAMQQAGVTDRILEHLQPQHPFSPELHHYMAKIAAETLLRDPALLRSLVDKKIQAGHVATFAGIAQRPPNTGRKA